MISATIGAFVTITDYSLLWSLYYAVFDFVGQIDDVYCNRSFERAMKCNKTIDSFSPYVFQIDIEKLALCHENCFGIYESSISLNVVYVC